jgi:hypothetical protein
MYLSSTAWGALGKVRVGLFIPWLSRNLLENLDILEASGIILFYSSLTEGQNEQGILTELEYS